MEKLNLVVFKSALSSGRAFEEIHAELLAALRGRFELSLCAPGEEEGREGFTLAFIASGGSENGFKKHYVKLPSPLFLLTDGLSNSLAASLEILSWVGEMGGRAEILHGKAADACERIDAAIAAKRARDALAASRIGVIGFPSDWLISSAVDYPAARRRWGTEFEEVELGRFDTRFAEVDAREAEEAGRRFAERAAGIVEPNQKDIALAGRAYLALKRLAAELGLDAFTLKCFDMLEKHGTTGCMALALLNEEGITAGCEGDERAVFSMHLGRLVTGETPFMANPAQIDAKSGSAIFAHCTIAPRMTSSFKLRSHFESGIGVGIQGIMEKGPVTVLKVGGRGLDRYFVSAGRIAENLDDSRRCRTQVRIELEEDASYFLRSPLANHHVILRGDHAAKLAAFLEASGATRVR